MPHLYGHKYLGPGTELRGQVPVDEDDYIAREHDENYAAGKNVRGADTQAIGEFYDDFRKSGNWHSALGALGLQGKQLVEGVVGQQYPRMAPLKRTGERSDHPYSKVRVDELPGPSSAKDFNGGAYSSSGMSSSGGDSGVNMMDVMADPAPPGRPNAGHGGGGSSVLMSKNPKNEGCSIKLYKTIYFTVYGYNFKYDNNFRIDPDLHYSSSTILTPYTLLPVMAPAFYMSPAEFDQLPEKATVKSVSCQVYPMYFRTPFATGETASGFANSHMGVLLVTHPAFNMKRSCMMAHYNADATTPTTPVYHSTYANDHITNFMYAAENGAASIGVPRHLNIYAVVLTNGGVMMGQEVSTAIFNDCIGKEIINYHYEPREGLLKLPHQKGYEIKPVATQTQTKTFKTVMGNNMNTTQVLGFKKTDLNVDEGWLTDKDREYFEATYAGSGTSVTGNYFNYNSNIEKCEILTRQGVTHDNKTQPVPMLGLLPTLANSVASPSAVIAEVSATFKCCTSIEILIPYFSPRSDFMSWPECGAQHYSLSADSIFFNHVTLGTKQFWMNGRFCFFDIPYIPGEPPIPPPTLLTEKDVTKKKKKCIMFEE